MDPFFTNYGEHNRLFLEQNGHELLMKIFTSPRLSVAKGSEALAFVFQSLSNSNPTSMLKLFFSVISSRFAELDTICNWRQGFYHQMKGISS